MEEYIVKIHETENVTHDVKRFRVEKPAGYTFNPGQATEAAINKPELKAGDELLIHDVWGAIHYKGPGVFIAGGAGVTPFIAIFRKLYKDGKISGNRLIFSNKTEGDIILKDEFERMLGNNFYNTLTREKTDKYDNRRIDENFIREQIKDFNQNFYVCGPDKFVQDIQTILTKLGASPDSVVFEE